MSILTDDGGGVSQFTVVVTSASYAGQLADGGCKDHFDPSCMVAGYHQKYGTKKDEGEGEQRNRSYFLSHC